MEEYQIIKFENEKISLDVRVKPDKETVCLTQKQMAVLFNVSTDNIGLHIKNIFKEGELDYSVAEESSVTANDGKNIFDENELNENQVCAKNATTGLSFFAF